MFPCCQLKSVQFIFSPCCCEEIWQPWTTSLSKLLLPPSLLLYNTTNQEFTTKLSALISSSNKDESTPKPHKTTLLEETNQDCLQSGDGYFEMSLDDSEEIMGCSSSSRVQDDVKKDSDDVNTVVWGFCVSAGEASNRRPSCLVATDSSLLVFGLEEPTSTLEELMKNLEKDLIVPYADVEIFRYEVPDVCVSLKVKSGSTQRWFFSDAQSLKELHSCVSPRVNRTNASAAANTQQFVRQFLNSWDFEENEASVKGGHLIHFFNPDSISTSFINPRVPSDGLSQIGLFESPKDQTSNPMILFLTSRHLCVLKVDFVALVGRDPSEANALRCCSKITRIPLTFTLLDPKQGCSSSRGFHGDHVIELMAGLEHLTVVFALSQDKLVFLQEFTRLRGNLREVKTIALRRNRKSCSRRTGHLDASKTSQRNTR